MLIIKLLTNMLAWLLIERNIKKGGPLMWIESHLSTIKSHPDFLWPDVGNVCRHRGEQYKLLTIWYKSVSIISDTKIAKFYCCWCALIIRRSDNCQYWWIYFPVLGTTTVTSLLISKGKSKTRLHCCRCWLMIRLDGYHESLLIYLRALIMTIKSSSLISKSGVYYWHW